MLHVLTYIFWFGLAVVVIAGARAGIKNPEKYKKPEPDMIIEDKRSTVTRVATGALLGGVPGALIGAAAKKKTTKKVYVNKDKS